MRSLVRAEGTRGGIVPRQELRSGEKKKRTSEDGIRVSQKLLLTWLTEDERLFDRIRPYIGVEDFTDPVLNKIAGELFAQHEEGHLNPAGIISMFEEEEDQKEAASVFHARVVSVETQAEKEKALKDTVLRIKQNSIEHRLRSREPKDLAGLQKLAEEKRLLEELKRQAGI
jgi:DNA primase